MVLRQVTRQVCCICNTCMLHMRNKLHTQNIYFSYARYIVDAHVPYATPVLRVCNTYCICKTCISHMQHMLHMQNMYFAYATYVAYAKHVFRICNICCIFNTFSHKGIFFQKVPDEKFSKGQVLIPVHGECTKLKRNLE